MKNLQEYIIEELEINESQLDEMIYEGKFWDFIKKLFGINKKKLNRTIETWPDELKNIFACGEYIAAKSKNKNERLLIKDISKALESGTKDAIIKLKEVSQKQIENVKNDKDGKVVVWTIRLLNGLSEFMKDKEGIEAAKKLSEVVKKEEQFNIKDVTTFLDKLIQVISKNKIGDQLNDTSKKEEA